MNFTHQAPEHRSRELTAKARVLIVHDEGWFEAKCFNLWQAHLEWLHDMGWTRAYEQQVIKAEDFGGPTGHEVVDLLNDFIFQTGYVNAHTGLTSSDIVDNVRLMQIAACLEILRDRGEEFREALFARASCTRETVGFTHWQPAAPLSWEHRVDAWLQPVKWQLVTPPCIFAKRFGGPVGDNASLKLLVESLGANLSDHPFNWHKFDLEHPNNSHPLQSSDHQCELAAVSWCCALAAQLHKIALDLRFLASHRVVALGRPAGHAGSSSMPHKMNPHKWEKVCSICRSVATTQQEMWQVAAHNSLERTLDTSWQLKSLLQRCFLGLAEALDLMADTQFSVTDHGTALVRELRPLLSSDRDLMRQVLSGKSRWAAYSEALSIHNKPTA